MPVTLWVDNQTQHPDGNGHSLTVRHQLVHATSWTSQLPVDTKSPLRGIRSKFIKYTKKKKALKADSTILEWLLRDSALAMDLLFKRQDTYFGCRSWTDFVWFQSKWGKKKKPFTKSTTSFLLILMRLGRSHQISRALSRSSKTGEKCSNISINNSAFLLPGLSKPPWHAHQHSCCKAAGLW